MRLPILALLIPTLAFAGEEMALPKPTPHHEALKAQVGNWDCVITVQMGPGKPPLVSKGTEVDKLVPGGLWITSEFASEMMGIPFEGRGIFGYDPAVGRHVGFWVDSTLMAPSYPQGTCKDDCREVTMTFEGVDMAGKKVTYKEVSVQKDADHRTMTMYTKGKEGDFKLMMVMEYTRRK
jgi:hypothetical protein